MTVRSFLVKRAISSLGVIVVILTVNFIVFRLIPGSPVLLIGFNRLTADQMAQLAKQFGLDKPLLEQYALYVYNTLSGQWGYSFVTQQAVANEIAPRLWNTLALILPGTLVAGTLGLLGGIFAAYKFGTKRSHAILITSIVLYAFPGFWIAIILLMFFGVTLHWFPVAGIVARSNWDFGYFTSYVYHLLLPLIVLVVTTFGSSVVVIRGAILETMTQDYVRLAVAKGLGARRVLMSHVVRNSLLPMITFLTLSYGVILTNTLLIEIVFSWGGIGRYLLNAVLALDYPQLQATFFIIGMIVVLANLLADIAYAFVDPRVRIG